MSFTQTSFPLDKMMAVLQSNQVKRTPQEAINEFIIQKLNPLLVVDFRLISAFVCVMSREFTREAVMKFLPAPFS